MTLPKTQSLTPSERLQAALDTALAQIVELMDEPLGTVPILHVEEDNGFWALAELRGDELHLVISTGCVTALDDLWERALAEGILMDDDGFQPADDVLVHVSLVWLILHELQHYDLGHFEKVGTTFLAETERGRQFALAKRRGGNPPATSNEADIEEMYRLEMEADADAIEMLLDAYSDDQWEELRYRIACVAAVMVLIDRADAALPERQSLHPPAKHRVAQLLAYVVGMPTSQSLIASASADKQCSRAEEFLNQVFRNCLMDMDRLSDGRDASMLPMGRMYQR